MTKRAQTAETVFAKRLKEARLEAGFTQAQLGVQAEIDEFSASPRINQYERGVHAADYGTAQRLAKALSVPVSYLYESDDQLAELIRKYGQLSRQKRDELATFLKSLS